jgi:peptide/nickel transport system permease protein
MAKNKNNILNHVNIESGIEAPQRVNEYSRFFKIFMGRPVVILGVIVFLLLLLCAAIPNWIAPQDPLEQDYSSVLVQPNSQHLLGTDSLGRDLLSRIIFGARTAIIVGFVAVGLAALVGVILGLFA